MRLKSIIVLLFFIILSCDLLEYSPHQVFDRDSPSNINKENISKLLNTDCKDSLTFVIIGDSQRSYDEIEQFVKSVNQFNHIDFVIIAGDISDFGLLQELEWVHNRLKKLNVPYFTVVGNHDVT
jgi:Icc protein